MSPPVFQTGSAIGLSEQFNAQFDPSVSIKTLSASGELQKVDGLANSIATLSRPMPPVSGPAYGKHLIGQAMYNRISAINVDECLPGEESPFYVADMGEVYRQHRRWRQALPRVTPHYAVKCNNDPSLLRLLANFGCGFDCASKAEIDLVMSFGVAPDRIVYAQPVKTKSFVSYARSKKVSQMTFDNVEELYKIKAFYPDACLLLRIVADDSDSLVQLSMKFGASLANVPELLKVARKLDLDVAGVAFHVGSSASDPTAFTKAVQDADRVFQLARACGMNPRILDIGGGFSHSTFESMSSAANAAIEKFFPESSNPGLRIIAEPGRYYSASAYILATNIIARRMVNPGGSSDAGFSRDTIEQWLASQADDLSKVAPVSAAERATAQAAQNPDFEDENSKCMLYINDGVYGNFNNIMFDHQKPVPKALTCGGRLTYGPFAVALPSQSVRSGLSSEAGSFCPTPMTVAGTGVSSPVRVQSSDNLNGAAAAAVSAEPAARPQKFKYSVWGPTCDGLDCVSEHQELEGKLDIGDWLYFEEMGSYTLSAASQFNGFSTSHDIIYVCSEPDAYPYLTVEKLRG